MAAGNIGPSAPGGKLENGGCFWSWMRLGARRGCRPGKRATPSMSKLNKVYEKLMAAQSDANFSFDDLRYLLEKLGYRLRQRGSHLIAQRGPSFQNLQKQTGKAKPYQVAQVRDDLKKFNIRPD
jgi:hypothetical protein